MALVLPECEPPYRPYVAALPPPRVESGIVHVGASVLPGFEEAVASRRAEITRVTPEYIAACLHHEQGTEAWKGVRRGRCGASVAAAACNGVNPLTGVKWVDDDQGGSFENWVYESLWEQFQGNYATFMGHEHEPDAIDRAMEWAKARHPDATGIFIDQEGAFINEDFPYMHASSDFIMVVQSPSGNWAYNGEAKCPASPNGYDGKVKPGHYHQMQQQMGTYMKRVHVIAAKHGVVLPPHWRMQTIYTVYSYKSNRSWIQLVDYDPLFYAAQCRMVEDSHKEMFRRLVMAEAGFIRKPETLPMLGDDLEIEVDMGSLVQEAASAEAAAEATKTAETRALLGL